MLANKQTAVIGGLTEKSKEDRETKVPILSSIPLLRQLFTYTEKVDVQMENVIFVTVSLEDGKKFDVDRAVQKSPLTRKQLVREEGNQVVDDRDVDLFKAREDGRIKEDVRIAEQKGKVESRDRTLRKPFWNFLRP
jgi:general secretion pathway protein D